MSDIWNEFEKIAVEQGLISEAEEGEKERNKAVRYDSLSDDAIRFLYNLEPENIFEEKDIIEAAHPETFVVGPAYDAMNAVIENINQRQDIMSYIALKQPNGHLTQRRYVAAKANLTNSLIRSAFLLDNREEDQLMALADSCTERLVKEAAVQAVLVPAAIAAGAAAVLGTAYYFLYGATTAQNVYVNSKMTLESLQPLSNQSYAEGIKTDISTLIEMASEIYQQKDVLGKITSVDAAITEAEKNPVEIKQIQTNLKNYILQLQKVYKAIPEWVNKIQLVHSATTEEQSDFWAKLWKGLGSVVWSSHEKLIDNLYGQTNWTTAGRTGGLYQAISEELVRVSQYIGAAKQHATEGIKQREIEAQKTAEPAPIELPEGW